MHRYVAIIVSKGNCSRLRHRRPARAAFGSGGTGLAILAIDPALAILWQIPTSLPTGPNNQHYDPKPYSYEYTILVLCMRNTQDLPRGKLIGGCCKEKKTGTQQRFWQLTHVHHGAGVSVQAGSARPASRKIPRAGWWPTGGLL